MQAIYTENNRMNIKLLFFLFAGLCSLNMQSTSLSSNKATSFDSILNKTDTIYIDLKKDVDFQFEKKLHWFEDSQLGLFGIMTKDGELFLEPMFSEIESFNNGISIVTFDNLQGAINQQGEIIIPFQYQELQSSSENRIAFLEFDKWGFFNTKGHMVIAPQFDYVAGFNEGLCLVSVDNKFGYINLKGTTVIPFIYDYASNFEDGQAFVQVKNTSFTIDTKGKKIAN